MLAIDKYLADLAEDHDTGSASENSYRHAFYGLIKQLAPDNVKIIDEPLNVTDCGNPDYVIMQGDLPLGFIETKKLGKDLDNAQDKAQFERYRNALDNLIITNYIHFRFFKEGSLQDEISIASLQHDKIKPDKDSYMMFSRRIEEFCSFRPQRITSSARLAKLMASKASLLENILERALSYDENKNSKAADADTQLGLVAMDVQSEYNVNTELQNQYQGFKDVLIGDLQPKDFADIYAQTLAYGMFAARLNDKTPTTFSRQEAAELIPSTTPFLKKLFNHIAGPDIDHRIKVTVDNLAEVFSATDTKSLLSDFASEARGEDLIVHFYETFLAAYDPNLRKSRGTYYTPNPVVDFIVRGVDHLLKEEFNLKDGLASSDKTTVEIDIPANVSDNTNRKEMKKEKREVHKVQILDPATGTGTFLANVVLNIYRNKFASQKGAWSSYVENHLLPRVHGFEIMMAPYAMSHLKLDFLFRQETLYKISGSRRLNIFLTNALEDTHPNTTLLFASWLSAEAAEANRIKREVPVMVILGNPPYNGTSKNRGNWIMKLMEDYKKEPGGKEKLKERNSKWLDDDYVKFMRYGQYLIEKNGEGILAYINPHGFLDNRTFRGMRWQLLKAYDKIYILDLHGNAKKKEAAPDGSPDKNVFDIQQGVAINFFVKTGKKSTSALAEVHHYDIYGSREDKYQFLREESLDAVQFEKLSNVAPMYFMRPRDFSLGKEYQSGFALSELFPVNSVGIVTARDKFTIHESEKSLCQTINKFMSLDLEEARMHFGLGKDVRDWKVADAKIDLREDWPNKTKISRINYRPFDARFTYYTGRSRGFHCMPRNEVMQHFLGGKNVGLAMCRQFKAGDQYAHAFITNLIMESSYVSNRTSEIASCFPLYLYPEVGTAPTQRIPNLDKGIIAEIEKRLGLPCADDEVASAGKKSFAPIDLLDYCYAVLYSPAYRARYNEFLKSDFPRVPYPKDKSAFWKLIAKGSELRQLHLFESSKLESEITSYPVSGDNRISRRIVSGDWEIKNKNKQLGRIWINDKQYFDKVPLVCWEYNVGGYKPSQKWLKDRVGQVLDYDAITHYQKIIVALSETIRLQGEINKIALD